jgi:quinol monooxygenase YgiN
MRRLGLATAVLIGFFASSGMVFTQQGAPPPTPSATSTLHVVSYIEVASGSESGAATALKQYRDAVRQEAGNQRTDLLQQTGRTTHFIVLESWENKAALDAHLSGANAKRLSDALAAQVVTPIDQWRFNPFSLATSATTDSAVFVVTHVDTAPPPPNAPAGAPNPGDMLKQLAEASRKEDGNLRFDVWQGDRRNHFTVVEAWRNQRALDAHIAAAQTRQYRSGMKPLTGSPLDERVLTVVK